MAEATIAPAVHDTIEGLPSPAENCVIVGQDEPREFLARALREHHLHHALLFEGPQGVGKATVAFHLANRILSPGFIDAAEGALAPPDVDSAIFRQIAGGTHPGILHITRPRDPRSGQFRTAITIDEIRRVTHLLTRTSHDGGWRIVIIDPAEDMNRNAANALLKTLEEPPARALFVLVSHSPGRLLPTIRSRCQAVRFQPLDRVTLEAAITRHGLVERHAPILPQLVSRAEGSVRQAALLILHGGIEIADAVDAVVGGRTFDVERAQTLAQAVSGRDAGVQYALFLDHLLNRVASRAFETAIGQGTVIAEPWSALWHGLREDAADAVAFNLDRKQTALVLLQRAHEAFAGWQSRITSAM